MNTLFGVLTCLAVTLQTPEQKNSTTNNLLPNPSFEETAAGGVREWSTRAWGGGENSNWTVESPGRRGGQCVSIRSEKGSDAAWTAVVKVQANSRYRLSGWIRTSNLHGAVGALLNIQNMQQVKTPRVTGTRDWTRVSTVFRTTQPASLEINCLYGGWGQSTGQAWYDDVCLEKISDAAEELQGSVTIDTDASPVPYSPLVRGGFIEHFHRQIYGGIFEPNSPLSDEMGFRKDVIEALKELKLSIVRWPGGCFASGYHWRDGVGKQRKPVFDVVWGVEDSNAFGTDEFVEWCRRVGCEPYLCTNAGNGTPEEMRDWVEYCNRRDSRFAALRTRGALDHPLNVRYWSIGNENWGGHEIGARTPQEWGPLVKKSAELMVGADPEIKLLAAATPNRDWTLPLLKTAGEHLQYVAIHEYWLPCWGSNLTPDYLTCVSNSEGPEATITRVIDLLDDAACRGRVKIAFDEWNLRGWHHPGFPRKEAGNCADPAVLALVQARDKSDIASQYTMADALFSASFLNACLRHAEDVGMANIAPIVNTRGPLFVHPRGVVKRTTFHVLAMYGSRLHDRVAAAEIVSDPLPEAGRGIASLDALATCDASKATWRIAMINRHPTESLRCEVKLGARRLNGSYRATILSGDSPDAFNDVDRPDRVAPRSCELAFKEGRAELPPHSLTIVEIN